MNNPTERPIIFDVQEVNAVLAGDKTQYRVPFDFEFIKAENVPIVQKVADETNCTLSELVTGAYNDFVYDFECPLGKVGDRLWVKELHARTEHQDHLTRTHYYAGNSDLRPDLRHDAGLLTKYDATDMPRWASRILLEITDIRIERVQDISEHDALAMGLKPDYCDHKYQLCEDIGCIGKWASALMLSLKFDHKIPQVAPETWVWLIEFKVIESSEVQSG